MILVKIWYYYKNLIITISFSLYYIISSINILLNVSNYNVIIKIKLLN